MIPLPLLLLGDGVALGDGERAAQGMRSDGGGGAQHQDTHVEGEGSYPPQLKGAETAFG